MRSFLTAATLLAFSSLSLAAPPSLESRGGGFEVKQVPHGHRFKNGPLEVEKTFNKFAGAGAVAPADVKAAAAAARKQKGQVAAVPEQFDQAYISPVTVGTSKLNLDFDTGSSDLWVFSTLTPAAEAAGHSKYNVQSGTLLRGETFRIKYGDLSSVAGVVYADKVVVGGVTATSQAVEAATSVSTQFVQNKPSDGILGLGFSNINQIKPKPQLTFFDNVKSTLQKALFTADLRAGAPGSYTFGYIDPSKYSGGITYVPVDPSNGFWQFQSGFGTTIADTGTSLVYLPANVVTRYYRKVPGATYDSSQGGIVFPCSETPPDFSVPIGGRNFVIPGEYINYAPLSASSSLCFGGIQPNTGIGFSILGDVFLKTVYVIFDESAGSPRIGFASK